MIETGEIYHISQNGVPTGHELWSGDCDQQYREPADGRDCKNCICQFKRQETSAFG